MQGSTFVLRLNFSTKKTPPSAIPKPLPASVVGNTVSTNEQLKNNNHPCTFKTENFGGLNVNENSMTTNYSLTTHNRSKATFPIEVIKIAT